MTTASKITMIRVVLIPVFMLVLLLAPGCGWLKWLALLIFIIANLSVLIDG